MTLQPEIRPDARLGSLTGMRFIAALLVFVSHIAVAGLFADAALNNLLLEHFLETGYVGVAFFFVLSGFILTWSSPPGDRPLRFYRRRLTKIYPNHFVTWLFGLSAMTLFGYELGLGNILPSLLLVQSWTPDVEVVTGTNAPSWTLACELLFYLSFPFLLRLVRRIPAERLWACAGAVVATIVIVPPFVAQFLPAAELLPNSTISWNQHWFVYFFPPTRLLDFVLGILLAQIVLTGRWIGLSRGVALLSVAAGYALMLLLPGAHGLVAPVVLPLGLLIAACAVADVQGTPSVLGSRPMVWLGELSFAFYIVHYLVFEYGPIGLAYILPGAQNRTVPEALVLIGATFAISLFLAWLLYRAVERPMMRRWSRPRDKAPAQVQGKVSGV